MAVPAEQFPAVVAAEQEDETVQVLPQLRDAVGRGCRRKRLARRPGSRASQPERNCRSSASSAASLAFSLTSGIGLPPSAVGRVGLVTVDLAAGGPGGDGGGFPVDDQPEGVVSGQDGDGRPGRRPAAAR
jgi:hypothetical protein